MPCEFLGVRTAHDRLEGYRNKCEFTIGKPFFKTVSKLFNDICTEIYVHPFAIYESLFLYVKRWAGFHILRPPISE